MKTKARVLFALCWVFASAVGKAIAACVVRPHGQGLSGHYLLHQLWPVWAASAAPVAFLMAYLFALWYSIWHAEVYRGSGRSGDKRGRGAA